MQGCVGPPFSGFSQCQHTLIFLLLASSSMSGVARVRMSQQPMAPRALRCWGRIIHLLLTNQSMPTEPMAQVGNLRPMAVRSARLPARRRPQGGMSQRHQFNHECQENEGPVSALFRKMHSYSFVYFPRTSLAFPQPRFVWLLSLAFLYHKINLAFATRYKLFRSFDFIDQHIRTRSRVAELVIAK